MDIPQDVLGIGLVGAFAAVFAGVIVLIARSARRQAQEKAEQAALLGFSPLPKPDPALVERIQGLYMLPGRRLSLRQVFYRKAGDNDLYLFDLRDTAGEDSSGMVEDGVAVVSPRLRLPRMTLLSRLEGTGSLQVGEESVVGRFLIGAANKAIEHLLMGTQRIEFPEDPEFNTHFFASSPDAEEARSFMTRERLARISRLRNVQIQMRGDIFTLSGYVIRAGQKKDETLAVLQQRLRDADYLAGWLMDDGSGPRPGAASGSDHSTHHFGGLGDD